MFFIDLWRFFIDPPYFSYNPVEQKTPVLCILTFEGPSETQIDLGISGVNIFT
jgi:hypothetical protein